MMMMMATCEACGVFGLACRLDLPSFNPSFLLPLPSYQEEPLPLLPSLPSYLLSCLSIAHDSSHGVFQAGSAACLGHCFDDCSELRCVAECRKREYEQPSQQIGDSPSDPPILSIDYPLSLFGQLLKRLVRSQLGSNSLRISLEEHSLRWTTSSAA
jgi:hypothetical protein